MPAVGSRGRSTWFLGIVLSNVQSVLPLTSGDMRGLLVVEAVMSRLGHKARESMVTLAVRGPPASRESGTRA